MKKIIIILGTVGVSFSAIFVRSATMPSMLLAFYRVFFAACIMFPFAYKEKKKLKQVGIKVKKRDIRFQLASLVSGIFLGFHFMLYFKALNYTSIASAVVLVDTEVFFVAMAMFFIWKDRLTMQAWIGIFITFLGSVVIAAADLGTGTHMLQGDLLAFLGAFCMAVYTMLGKYCRKAMTTTRYTFQVYSAASLILAMMAFVSKTDFMPYAKKDYFLAFLLAAVCTIGGHSVYSWGLKYEKASFVSIAKLLEPVFASVFGFFIFYEKPSIQVIFGGIVVIVGISCYSLQPSRRESVLEP